LKTGKARQTIDLKKKTFLNIVTHPDPILGKEALPVTAFNADLIKFATDMIHTMNSVKGVGLAAPQVGQRTRMCMALLNKQPVVLINPVITAHSDALISIKEGCLSCPDESVRIDRYDFIKVTYNDVKGTVKHIDVYGVDAIILQHELDHLNGKTIMDYKDASKQ
jgi:peptide deformylase